MCMVFGIGNTKMFKKLPISIFWVNLWRHRHPQNSLKGPKYPKPPLNLELNKIKRWIWPKKLCMFVFYNKLSNYLSKIWIFYISDMIYDVIKALKCPKMPKKHLNRNKTHIKYVDDWHTHTDLFLRMLNARREVLSGEQVKRKSL